MPQADPGTRPKFISVRQIGLGGLQTKSDPQDLKDIESPDMRNISFDGGSPGPRYGTTLYIAKPVGESGNPSQLLKAKDSDGTTYVIAVYGQNFYLLDQNTTPPTWIKISPAVLPTQSGLFYGSASWNLGTGSDAFYFGNGVDIVMKWIPMLTSISKAAASGDSYITVADPTLFPSGAISVNVLVGAQAVTLTNNATGASVVFLSNPTNGLTYTLDINGSTVTGHFVTGSVGSAGDVLIGPDLATTFSYLLNLLQNPGTSNANQQAFSSGDQTTLGNYTFSLITQSDNSSSFSMTPNSTITSLVVGGTSAPQVTYTNPNNTITVSGTVGANLASGTGITNQITTVGSIPRGNRFIVGTAQGGFYRLFVAGVPSQENILYYSQAYNPLTAAGAAVQELFPAPMGASTGSGTLVSGWYPMLDGEGGIEDMVDFGQYLGIVKANAVVQFFFTIDTTDDTIGPNTNPTIYGESVFPVGAHLYPKSGVNLTVENALYIVTSTQGIFQYIPASTGAQLTTTITPFSDDIISLFTSQLLSFSMGRVEYFNRQLMYLCSSIPSVNNLVLIYDFIWGAWTIWDNLNAVDVKEISGTLYFLCNDDGGLYYYDSTSFQDARSGQAVGYTTYMYTKRFDAGEPANPKQNSLALVQGYITANTKLYVDVLYNEGGLLAASTYEIDGSNTDYVLQLPLYTPGRISLGQNPIGGAQIGTIGVFRVYLDLLYRAGAHVVQAKFYTENAGDQFGITGFSLNPELNQVVPSQLKIGIA